jgi:hypothetical protein
MTTELLLALAARVTAPSGAEPLGGMQDDAQRGSGDGEQTSLRRAAA